MKNKLLVVGVLACAVEQKQLENFLAQIEDLRDVVKTEIKIVLALDTFEKITDISKPARQSDCLVFHRQRIGFGTARQAVVNVAAVCRADSLIIVDGDGQYDGAGLGELANFLIAGDYDVVYPQRKTRDLPLADDSGLNRLIAEYFQNYALAQLVGRPEFCWVDLQTGALGLSAKAIGLLRFRTGSRGFSWDMEFSHLVLVSELKIGMIDIDVRGQIGSLFKIADFEEVMSYLVVTFGRAEVLGRLDVFTDEPKTRSMFLPDQIKLVEKLIRKSVR